MTTSNPTSGHRPLADVLAAERDAIVLRFKQRAQAEIAPRPLSDRQLEDHLPQLLDNIVRELRATQRPTAVDAAAESSVGVRALAAEHGEQRLRVGYDLVSLVAEYDVLRDCIFERLDAAGAAPTLAELRHLVSSLAKGITSSVAAFAAHQEESRDRDRRELLGLFEQAPGFVGYARGRELTFDLVNAAYYQLVGHRELIGRTLRDAMPELAGQGYYEILDEVFATGRAFVGRNMRLMIQADPAGPLREAFVDFVYQPIRDASGAVVGILAQGHDVSEAHRAEVERQASEATRLASELRYRSIFEAIDDGYAVIEMIVDDGGVAVDYRFLETNAAFERHTGLRDAVGKSALVLVPGLDPSWIALYARVAETGETARLENYDPAMERWFDVYASRVGDAAMRQVAVVFKDVSARKRAESERQQLLARESAARREAEDASRLRDEFLATVSHELRTPLTAMLGWAHRLRAGNMPPDKQERAYEIIERNARAQAQLIDDLLDISRILAGKLSLEPTPMALDDVVAAAVESVRPAADARGVVLNVRSDRETPVMGDAHRLQQIVWNLLSNAVKFSKPGGNVVVDVGATPLAVALRVTDDGKGIDPSFLPHVFERFRQQDGGTTRTHGGLGLGLSIVRQLVELHGGTVDAASDGPGHGASFTVTLPRAAPLHARAPSGRFARAGARVLEGLDVLLVDDDDDTRDLVVDVLTASGARTRTANCARDGFALLRAAPPHVLVSDVGMPDEDGYSFIARVRALDEQNGGKTMALAMTAYVSEADRARALASGFNAHVAKPVEPRQLVGVIAELVGRRRGG